jgi:hypothetical protein
VITTGRFLEILLESAADTTQCQCLTRRRVGVRDVLLNPRPSLTSTHCGATGFLHHSKRGRALGTQRRGTPASRHLLLAKCPLPWPGRTGAESCQPRVQEETYSLSNAHSCHPSRHVGDRRVQFVPTRTPPAVGLSDRIFRCGILVSRGCETPPGRGGGKACQVPRR